MKLRSKLLTSFILTTLVLVISSFFLLRWTFEHGAITYMQQEDQEQLDALAKLLAEQYTLQKSWQPFQNNTEYWFTWLSEQEKGFRSQSKPPPFPDQRFHPEPPPYEGSITPSRPIHDRPPRTKPFYLLDASGQLVVGHLHEKGLKVPISVADHTNTAKVVGFVGLPPPPSRLHGFRDTSLVSKQRELLIMFMGGALFISILSAIPLSARLSHRIMSLHHYVTSITQGVYENRLSVKGNDEIADLALHLNQLAQSLADTQRQRQQMTADISHELRTPVATLQANIEAMQDDVLPLTQESLAILHQQTQRLGKLIHDLYQLSLADANALDYHKGPCDLVEVLNSLVEAYWAPFQLEKLSLSLKILTQEPPIVWGDEGRLKQVFINLLENSRQYTSAPGTVIIALDVNAADNQAIITVSDSSPGVDKDLQPRLTDRLFRVDASRDRNTGGTGLGLNLCAAIVQAHQGEISFDDSTLGGLAVIVSLPITPIRNEKEIKENQWLIK